MPPVTRSTRSPHTSYVFPEDRSPLCWALGLAIVVTSRLRGSGALNRPGADASHASVVVIRGSIIERVLGGRRTQSLVRNRARRAAPPPASLHLIGVRERVGGARLGGVWVLWQVHLVAASSVAGIVAKIVVTRGLHFRLLVVCRSIAIRLMSNARIPCLIGVEGSEAAAPGGVGVTARRLVGTCRSAVVVLLELAEPSLNTAGGRRRGVVGVGKRV